MARFSRGKAHRHDHYWSTKTWDRTAYIKNTVYESTKPIDIEERIKFLAQRAKNREDLFPEPRNDREIE